MVTTGVSEDVCVNYCGLEMRIEGSGLTLRVLQAIPNPEQRWNPHGPFSTVRWWLHGPFLSSVFGVGGVFEASGHRRQHARKPPDIFPEIQNPTNPRVSL